MNNPDFQNKLESLYKKCSSCSGIFTNGWVYKWITDYYKNRALETIQHHSERKENICPLCRSTPLYDEGQDIPCLNCICYGFDPEHGHSGLCINCFLDPLITTPCYCEFLPQHERNRHFYDTLSDITYREGDRCFTCNSLDCYETQEPKVHYVLEIGADEYAGCLGIDLSEDAEVNYYWSCKPLTRRDYIEGQIKGFQYIPSENPITEGMEHVGPSVDISECVDNDYFGA